VERGFTGILIDGLRVASGLVPVAALAGGGFQRFITLSQMVGAELNIIRFNLFPWDKVIIIS
jgi:hypothetical protein